jgi:hypothetical protein
MKRVRTKKVKRERRKNSDPFADRCENPYDLLNEFLTNRRMYIKKHYTENNQIVLFELDLYQSVLNRIKQKFT